MENTDIDETQPYPTRPEENGDASHIENTMPSMVAPQQPVEPDPAETMPVPVESAADSGFEHTLPPPVEPSGASEELEMTVPTHVEASSDSVTPPPITASSKHSFPLRLVAFLGVLLLILIAAGSAYGGYQSGINNRTSAESTQTALQVQEQFELGVQDMEARRYDLARQRFEYVIQYQPGYPGVTEKLAEVLLSMNSTATPTLAPTPTVTPTPDTRNIDELYTQAQGFITNKEWTPAIDTLLSLRKADPTYQPVWIDDMLYIAYRNRGSDKILKDGDLEGGIYDLAQAEQIGPLDADAKSYLTWASLYKTGASFWELDWAQAVYYFAQIAPALPNLRDGSGWTATERLRLALAGYGDFLAKNGDACTAVEQFDQSLGIGYDAQVEEARNNAADECGGGGNNDSDEGSSSGESQPEPTNPPAVEPPPTEPAPTEVAPTEPAPTEAPPPAESTPVPNP
jgi:hypothetical protein